MAGGISEEDIQKVREANDLVEVIGERTPVKQRGRDFWCCCPLHNEKTPSFDSATFACTISSGLKPFADRWRTSCPCPGAKPSCQVFGTSPPRPRAPR